MTSSVDTDITEAVALLLYDSRGWRCIYKRPLDRQSLGEATSPDGTLSSQALACDRLAIALRLVYARA